jgi:hypothetical protein
MWDGYLGAGVGAGVSVLVEAGRLDLPAALFLIPL